MIPARMNSGKDDTGNGGDSGKDDSGNTDKPDDKPEETKILTGEAEVASNEYGSVSGTYQVKVKVTVDKDGNIISEKMTELSREKEIHHSGKMLWSYLKNLAVKREQRQ